jgi:hypothetical protein
MSGGATATDGGDELWAVSSGHWAAGGRQGPPTEGRREPCVMQLSLSRRAGLHDARGRLLAGLCWRNGRVLTIREALFV